MLALRKLQLLQQHLRLDNQPVLVLAPTATHGALYLGSVGASHHLPHLLTAGVTHVLSVGRNLAQPFPQHFQYFYVPMLDSSTTRIPDDVYEACFDFIEKGRTALRNSGPVTAQQQQRNQHSLTPANMTDDHTGSNNFLDAPPLAGAESSASSASLGLTGARAAAGGRSAGIVDGTDIRAALAQTEADEGRLQASSARQPRLSPTLAAASSSSFGAVLVHCFAGKSRSTTILLSYLMRSQRWSLDKAYAHVKAVRPAIAPNPGFVTQLRELEAKLRAKEAAADEAAGRNSGAHGDNAAAPVATLAQPQPQAPIATDALNAAAATSIAHS